MPAISNLRLRANLPVLDGEIGWFEEKLVFVGRIGWDMVGKGVRGILDVRFWISDFGLRNPSERCGREET
jgi:hypothetical protein